MSEFVIRVEGLEGIAEAICTLARAIQGENEQVVQQNATAESIVQKESAPVAVPPQFTAVQQPVIPAPIATQSAAPVPTPAQVPTTAAPQQYSFDQIAVAMSNLCANMGKQSEVHALLSQFGVNALFDLPKERYGEFATALRGIGGVI